MEKNQEALFRLKNLAIKIDLAAGKPVAENFESSGCLNLDFCFLGDFWRIVPSLKLTACTWKWMVGRRLFPFGIAYFQGRTVSFGECTRVNPPSFTTILGRVVFLGGNLDSIRIVAICKSLQIQATANRNSLMLNSPDLSSVTLPLDKNTKVNDWSPGDSSRDPTWSPIWRSSNNYLCKGSRFHHPKKVTSRIARPAFHCNFSWNSVMLWLVEPPNTCVFESFTMESVWMLQRNLAVAPV